MENVKELQSWLDNPQKIYQYGFDSLTPELREIYKNYGLDALCNAYKNATDTIGIAQRKNCEGQVIIMTLRQEQTRHNLATIEGRVGKIHQIAQRMATSKDQKESQDLNNAMQTQLTLLQADKLKMDIQAQHELQQEKLIEKQKEDLFKQQLRMNKPTNTGSWD